MPTRTSPVLHPIPEPTKLTDALSVRVLGPGDEALLESVGAGVFDDPIDARATREFLNDPRHHIAVALDGDTVVGFASGVHYVHPDKPRPEFWINEVGVVESHRRRGAGKAVIEALLGEAKRLGCSEAWVLTDRANDAGMALYRSTGAEYEPQDSTMFTYKLV